MPRHDPILSNSSPSLQPETYNAQPFPDVRMSSKMDHFGSHRLAADVHEQRIQQLSETPQEPTAPLAADATFGCRNGHV